MIDSFCNQTVSKLPPHVYGIAEASYREMLNSQKNQSILVSGESGAGKTESTKFLLQYFAAMGEKMGQSKQEALDNNNIESQVIKSTPILEAFGNAKTSRNDNSSRFGKFIQIHFDKTKGTIVGANLDTYLLEKSRIVRPPQHERSYHIFYQFLAGVGDDIRSKLVVTSNPTDFVFLSQSECHTIDDIDDGQVFLKTQKALKVMGFTDDDQMGVWKVLAAILHCGNIQFAEKEENVSAIVDEYTLESTQHSYSPLITMAELLGCKIDQLKNTLLTRIIKAGNETYTLPMTVQQSKEAKDSLAMYLYSRLFDWIVHRINICIDKKKKDYLFIGILDIYGFESFETNSFEQFTINYANEKLQNQFNHQIFKLEQQEYTKEKIDWSYIKFNDNQDCIDLIEKKPLGILSIMDEETQFPKATPVTLTTKLTSNHHNKTKHFEKPRFSNVHFTIDHYAGKVDYDTTLFLEKNKDFIIPEQVMALQASSWEFFRKLVTTIGGSATKGPAPSASAGGKSLKFLSVTSQFKESLNHLMTTINSTNPHYIRCIKPNTQKQPDNFSDMMVLQQLRCGGVIEQLRISRSGYPGRLPYENFFKRYKVLASRLVNAQTSALDMTKEPRKGSEVLMRLLSIDGTKVQLGLTKIFFRSGIIANLEIMRGNLMRASAIMIQKYWKGFVCKKRYVAIQHAAKHLQSLVRRATSKQIYIGLLEDQSSLVLQTAIRSTLAARDYQDTLVSATKLQGLFRVCTSGEMLEQLRIERASEILQSYVRMAKEAEHLHLLNKACLKAQTRWRGKMARKEYTKLKIEARSLNHVVEQKNKLELKVEELQYRMQAEQRMREKEADLIKELKRENQLLKQQLEDKDKEIERARAETEKAKAESEERIQSLNTNLQQLERKFTTPPRSTSPEIATPEVSPPYIIRKPAKETKDNRQQPPPQEENYSTTPPPDTDTPLEEADTGSSSVVQSPPVVVAVHTARKEDREHDVIIYNSPEMTAKAMEVDEHLHREVQLLREKESSHQVEIDNLNDLVHSLREQLESEKNKTPLTMSHSSSSNSLSRPESPRDSAVTSRASSDSETEHHQPQQQQHSPSHGGLKASANGISDLVAALDINNNQLTAGKYLVDMLLKETFSFVVGTIPEPCYILSRCYLADIVMNCSVAKVEVMHYFVDSVASLTKESHDNELLCFWLSNISLMLKVLDSAIQHPPSLDASTGSDEDIDINDKLPANISMESLQIKTQLQTLITKVYKSLVNNILGYIQPLCHRMLNEASSESDAIEQLTCYLTNVFSLLQLCHVYDPIRQSLFEQIFHYIDSLMFNEIVLRRDLCCLRSSIQLKINISELEHWAKSYGKEWSVKAISHLSQLKETIYILMIDKTLLTHADIRKEVCPSITTAQIKQLLTMYTPDLDSVEEPIPIEVLSALMSSEDYSKSENILLDLSSIFTIPMKQLHCLTMDDLTRIQHPCDSIISMVIKKNIESHHPTNIKSSSSSVATKK
ncbi:hypothetical protein SAMD00019534_104060 [Acytostelium subglobosum LB1]|uniref:hypothetical protein n=1 Tax=Acytostelium subglobosum LB1 TaxID=1410327 RepID=UPI0006447C4B|nr:hypothetical protein SAMD00019534_104060 [Acytostelium subglobosum LB1]GAM27231.1 hypothetical protein SAMD00019534_104060 [Acytostelium subglobosum LB1]|eukprot:XP_012749698.1 hypothetical protein SAMD00019534_104060 [Acytostelium subglobosum LB1]